MGKLLSDLLAIKDKIDLCLKIAERIDTRSLNFDMCDSVYNYFSSLRPLSLKMIGTGIKDDSGKEVLIWKWFYKEDHVISLNTFEDPMKFFDFIRKHGEQVEPFVRREVAEEFSSLVDLAAKLKMYKNLKIRLDIPPTRVYLCHIDRGIRVEQIDVCGLALHTNGPYDIHFIDPDGDSICDNYLYELKFFVSAEDLMDYLIQLYRKAEDALSETVEHNNRILERMENVAAPFIVANNVTEE